MSRPKKYNITRPTVSIRMDASAVEQLDELAAKEKSSRAALCEQFVVEALAADGVAVRRTSAHVKAVRNAAQEARAAVWKAIKSAVVEAETAEE